MSILSETTEEKAKAFLSGLVNLKSAEGTFCNSPVCNAGSNENDLILSAEGTIRFFTAKTTKDRKGFWTKKKN